jgi:phosphoribosylformylglycinamidine synthase
VRAGDAIALAGPFRPALPGSELAKLRGEALPVGLPAVDIALLRAAQEAIRDGVRDGSLSSAHDVAEGGLLVAVAESCLAGGVGATLDLGAGQVVGAAGAGGLDGGAGDLDAGAGDLDRVLFGESPGAGFIVSGTGDALRRLGERVALKVLGTVGGASLKLVAGETRAETTLDELHTAHAALAPLFA